jgi:hypothetical protein
LTFVTLLDITVYLLIQDCLLSKFFLHHSTFCPNRPFLLLTWFPFGVLSHSAFLAFNIMSIQHFVPFDILSFQHFLPFDILSFGIVSHSMFCHSTFCTFGICYFDILSVNPFNCSGKFLWFVLLLPFMKDLSTSSNCFTIMKNITGSQQPYWGLCWTWLFLQQYFHFWWPVSCGVSSDRSNNFRTGITEY